MRIIIVGGGVVGSSLAEHLLRDGHTLALIEADSKLCQTLSEKHDLQILNGSGSSPQLLREAGIEGAELLVAVTPDDELNMVVCAIAAQHDVPQRIARLRDREYRKNNPHFDIEKGGGLLLGWKLYRVLYTIREFLYRIRIYMHRVGELLRGTGKFTQYQSAR